MTQHTTNESETWETYVGSWNTSDDRERKTLYLASLAPDCVYADPIARTEGWEELMAYMIKFSGQIPGARFVTQRFQAHHGACLAHWNMVAGDGTILGDGVSHGRFGDDGKLIAMTGFFDAPGVSDRVNYLDELQAGVDFIEAHLDHDFELADVARAAGMSRWHFQRIFSAVTGETLKTYIRSRRLARSLERLASTDMRIIDIAILAGFESQETFTRAFRKAFDMTPFQYRKLGRRTLFLRKAQFDADYLQHITTNVSMEPKIVEQPPMILVGMRTLFFSVDSEKNNIAEQLPPLWDAFVSRLDEIEHRGSGPAYGVVRQESPDSDRLVYDAAVEVSETAGQLPDGMVRFDLPAATYAHFTHRGPATDLDRTVNYVYSTWLTSSGHRHTYGPDLEMYGEDYHPTSADSTIGYAIPIVDEMSAVR